MKSTMLVSLLISLLSVTSISAVPAQKSSNGSKKNSESSEWQYREIGARNTKVSNHHFCNERRRVHREEPTLTRSFSRRNGGSGWKRTAAPLRFGTTSPSTRPSTGQPMIRSSTLSSRSRDGLMGRSKSRGMNRSVSRDPGFHRFLFALG